MMLRLWLFILVNYIVVAGDQYDPDVKVHFFPQGCVKETIDIDAKTTAPRKVMGCNRKKTITEEGEIEQCDGQADLWHLVGDLSKFNSQVLKVDQYSRGRYLNLSNVEHCTVGKLVKSCTDPTELGEAECKAGQDTCDLKLPPKFSGQPVFKMQCPKDRIGEATADVSEAVYLWNPEPLPEGVTLKFHIEKPDPVDNEGNECAEAEIKKAACSTPTSWKALKEGCDILKKDNLHDKPTCGYKIVAEFDAPAYDACILEESDRLSYFPLLWNFEDVDIVNVLEHFTVESVVLTDAKYVDLCEELWWREASKVKESEISNKCVVLNDRLTDANIYKQALKKMDGKVKADFSARNISFGQGGLFAFHQEGADNCGSSMPTGNPPHFQISLKWTRLSKVSEMSKSKMIFTSTGGESCTVKPVPITDRKSFETAVKTQCYDIMKPSNNFLTSGTIKTERKKLQKCENLDTTFLYEFDENELNFFDQLSSVQSKDGLTDYKYGAFLTVWNIPTDCEIMTETYRHGVTKFGCDAKRWSPNNHYHKGQPVFVSQVFGFDNHNPIAIRFDCPDDKVKRDFSKLEGRLLSIMTTREPDMGPRDWIIEKAETSEFLRYDKERLDNAKRVKYILRAIDKSVNPKACDLKKCDGMESSWFKKPGPNAEVEGYYPWDFDCPDLFTQGKCDFILELQVSVSGLRDATSDSDDDPQLYMCDEGDDKVRIVWEEKLPQFGWDKFTVTAVILDESTKCSHYIDMAPVDVSLAVGSFPANETKNYKACTIGARDLKQSTKRELENGKIRFSASPSMSAAKGIDIKTPECFIGKSEVTVVMQKTITDLLDPKEGLYGQFVSE